MIIGTAGHIDHGKTTLVRALTGVDTDRLPEEKARGISIELGYAYLDVPDHLERIGFIDVPGHEKLVHTMPQALQDKIKAAFLALDPATPQGKEILGLQRATRFIATKPDNYVGIKAAAENAGLLK